MGSTVRAAQMNDVEAMVALSEQKRSTFEAYQPTLWKKAADSREKQIPFFEHQINRDNVIALVHETEGVVDGFVIATVVPAPPVYNPGGLTCVIDDYCTAQDPNWDPVGAELWHAVTQEAKARGVVLVVVVTAQADEAKRSFLRSQELTIASEWWVKEL